MATWDEWTAKYYDDLVCQLFAALYSRDKEQQEQAVLELEHFCHNSEMHPALLPHIESDVIPLLHHSDAMIRSTGVRMLAIVLERRAADIIAQLLHDREPSVRSLVAIYLDGLDDPRGLGYVQEQMAAADIENRQALLGALYEYSSDRSLDFLLRTMRSDADARLRTAAMCAGMGRYDSRLIRQFIAMCFDEDDVVRAAANETVDWLVNSDFTEVLNEIVRDGTPVEQVVASRALAQIAEKETAKGPAWWETDRARILRPIYDALPPIPLIAKELGVPDDTIPVIEVARRALELRQAQPRIAAIRVLETIDDPQALTMIKQLLYDDDCILRIEAVKSLAKQGQEYPFDLLLDALQMTVKWIPDAAAEALGELGDPRGIEPLITALSNPRQGVRINAACALTQITGQDFGQDAISWRQWWETSS